MSACIRSPPAVSFLAAHARELDREKQRLVVSLSAREEDILVSDRQMQALSMRLKGEARASGEAAAGAEAVAEELRRALEDVTATADDGKADGKAGDPTEGERVVDRCVYVCLRGLLFLFFVHG